MELVYTNSKGEWQGCLQAFGLDLAFGSDENDFQLTVPTGTVIEPGALVFEPFTEYGGTVDGDGFDNESGVPMTVYKGRTWHGIMASSVLRPDPGNDYLTVNGEANSVISQLIARQGLQGVFTASETPSGVNVSNYRFARYTDLYTGLKAMLAGIGMRLDVEKGEGLCILSAVPAAIYGNDGVDSNRFSFKAQRTARTVNHLICLGKGQLAQRTVIDLYMDENGNVSRTQSAFGLDNIEQAYNFNSADESELITQGTKKLQEYREASSSAEVSAFENQEFFIGDVISASSVETGFSVSAAITKKIVNVNPENSLETVNYQVGDITEQTGFVEQ